MAALARAFMSARSATAVAASVSGSTSVRCMATGTVKWFNLKKGFGFITPDDTTQPDVFAHHTAIQSNAFRFLKDGEKVKFDFQQSDRGVQAVNITTPEGTPFHREPQAGHGGPREDRGERSERPRSPRRSRSEDAGRE